MTERQYVALVRRVVRDIRRLEDAEIISSFEALNVALTITPEGGTKARDAALSELRAA
jgi:hypothetical protein